MLLHVYFVLNDTWKLHSRQNDWSMWIREHHSMYEYEFLICEYAWIWLKNYSIIRDLQALCWWECGARHMMSIKSIRKFDARFLFQTYAYAYRCIDPLRANRHNGYLFMSIYSARPEENRSEFVGNILAKIVKRSLASNKFPKWIAALCLVEFDDTVRKKINRPISINKYHTFMFVNKRSSSKKFALLPTYFAAATNKLIE